MIRTDAMRPLRQMGWLFAAYCLVSTAVWADQPVTGPETEKRFPPLKIPEGFRATLFACDPLVEYPSVIAIGPESGTLFVETSFSMNCATKMVFGQSDDEGIHWFIFDTTNGSTHYFPTEVDRNNQTNELKPPLPVFQRLGDRQALQDFLIDENEGVAPEE